MSLNPWIHLYLLLCCQDINTLVDALIDEESTLLTRRRHREGLIQLLSRLYEVDVTAEAWWNAVSMKTYLRDSYTLED